MLPEPISTLLLNHNRFKMALHVSIQHDICETDLWIPKIEKVVEVTSGARKRYRDRRPRPAL